MLNVLASLVGAVFSFFKTQRALALENLALRHQIGVLKRTLGTKRVCLKPCDRKLWVLLFRVWTGWQQVLAIVQPATVIRWHREGFRRFWARKSRRRGGRLHQGSCMISVRIGLLVTTGHKTTLPLMSDGAPALGRI
jgi:hypothetical protein